MVSGKGLSDAEAARIWRGVAADLDGVPEVVQDMANVNEKGQPRAGGLTEFGRMCAADMPEVISRTRAKFADLLNEGGFVPDNGKPAKAKVDASAAEASTQGERAAEGIMREMLSSIGAERRAAGEAMGKALHGWPALLVGMGLTGPIRATLRAAAQAFAVALDDGATDDAGSCDRGAGGVISGVHNDPVRRCKGDTVIEPHLGHAPYVVLRFGVTEIEGQVMSAVTVSPGGDGLGPDDGEGSLVDLRYLLKVALRGVQDAQDRGVDVNGAQTLIAVKPPAGSGPNTEDPYGDRSGDTPPETPTPVDKPGDDRGAPARTDSAPASDDVPVSAPRRAGARDEPGEAAGSGAAG